MGFGGAWGIVATGKREREECEVGFLSALSPWAGCIPLLKAAALSGSPLHPLVLVTVHPPTLSGSQVTTALPLLAPESRGSSTH